MKAIGLTRLGRDAELKYLDDGTPVANLALAYNYGRKGQDGNQPTQWVQASLWGKRAEKLTGYLTKGTAIVATLSDVHVRTFTKGDGTEGFGLNARVDDLEFAGGGQEKRQQQAPQAAPQAAPAGDDDLDDDIPF